MSTSQINLVLTLEFADNTEKNVSVEDVSATQQVLNQIKTKLLAINTNAAGQYDPFYQLFLSNEGANFTRIANARLVTIEEEVIYNG